MKRMLVALLIVVVVACSLTACASSEQFDTSILPQYEYVLNEQNNGLGNIPFDEYLKGSSDTDTATKKSASQVGASEDNDGVANATALNIAIDELSSNGGGVLIIDGNYKVSTVELKSNVTISISQGCSLISLDCEENNSASSKLTGGVITAYGAENIGICGPGKIDGQGESFSKDAKESSPLQPLEKFNVKERVLGARSRIREGIDGRVNLIYFDDCSGIKLQGFEMYRSASWTCHLRDCDNIEIKDCVINNNFYVANTDGIDIVGCQDVKIEHCFIVTGDDGIVVKAHSNEDVNNVSVKSCKIMSLANNFKIGTETSKKVENITVEDCDFFMAGLVGGYSGLAIESADGSNISKVSVSQIRMNGVSSPLLIWLGNRLEKKNGSDGKSVGSISDIDISDVYCDNVELPSAIVGVKVKQETYCVENVNLKNFYVRYRDTQENLDVKVPPLESGMNGYPEITRVSHRYLISHEMSEYYDLPVYGLYLRYVDGLAIDNFKVISRKCSKLDKWNIDGDLAESVSNVTIKK